MLDPLDMPNKSLSRVGVMQKLEVYAQGDTNKAIGYGYLVTRYDGQQLPPDLYDNEGNRLPKAWYTIRVMDETQLIVIPRRIQ